MTCAYLYAYIRVIGKTDPKQYNKKSISTFKINEDIWKVILLKDICFSSAISFFSECFQLKYSRNLLRSKYDLTMMTFSSWTDTRQISAAPKFSPVSDSTFWKMISFETKWIAFFGAKSRCLLPRSRSPARAIRCADETLSFQDYAMIEHFQ